MTETKTPDPVSVFSETGLAGTINALVEQTANLYRADDVPWVVGYSGGKDSTATLSIVWRALASLEPDQRTKTVHVISTDTMVENPVVSSWVEHSLAKLRTAALDAELPVEAHALKPELQDTFWVNLIGKGYPAPRPMFRWCTERLKIKPSNRFIKTVVRQAGEAILVLGTRKAESSGRHSRMEDLESRRVRDLLSPNDSLPNSLVYTPIENWSNDDVWLFLMQMPNPWGYDNKALLTMYRGASADNECPLVVDTSTPSCGDSRFGCWVCTLVSEDKSMSAMIQNDEEKEWMLPLLELRSAFEVGNDRALRDFRRLTGRVQLFPDGQDLIPGPYTQESRARWLRMLLEAQTWARENGPSDVADLELISREELHEIRRMWVFDKHETEDLLPRIYEEATGQPFDGPDFSDRFAIQPDDLAELRAATGDDPMLYEMVRNLIGTEHSYRSQVRRAGLFDELAKTIERSWYADADDALEWAQHVRRDSSDEVGPVNDDAAPPTAETVVVLNASEDTQ